MILWRRFRRLSAADRALLAEALPLLICVQAGLHVVPFASLRRRLERRRLSVEHPVDRIVWAVRAITRRLPGTTCLTQALVAHSMLRRHGHAPALRIGVRQPKSPTLDAHAWVECDGAIVIGTIDTLADYAILS